MSAGFLRASRTGLSTRALAFGVSTAHAPAVVSPRNLDAKGWWLVSLIALGGCECGERSSSETAPEPSTTAAGSATAVPFASTMPPRRTDVPPKCRTLCRIAGRCTLHPESQSCLATTDDDCRRSRACIVNGMCTAQGGLCLGTSDEDCQRSTRCKDEGLCSLAGGTTMTATNCIAKTDDDCTGSKTCTEQKRCKAVGNRCDDPDNPIKGPPPERSAPPPP